MLHTLSLALLLIGTPAFAQQGMDPVVDVIQASFRFLTQNELPKGTIVIDFSEAGMHPPVSFAGQIQKATGAIIGNIADYSKCTSRTDCSLHGASAVVTFGTPATSGDSATISVLYRVQEDKTVATTSIQLLLRQTGHAWQVERVLNKTIE